MEKIPGNIREPVVAGMFYPAEKEALKKEIEACFLHDFGPKELPPQKKKKQTKKVQAAIMPHAGYSYSGPCAAHGYFTLAQNGKPDTILLLGPNHTGLGNNGISFQDWKTPFGIIKNNKSLSKAIAKATALPIDELPHREEHSIEVQLPFLQHLWKETPSIVPIVLGYPHWQKIGKNIREVLNQWEESVLIIASSDFIHYGINYNYVPFFADIKKNITTMDEKAWQFIKEKDTKAFLQWCDKTGATICGKYPIAVLLEAIKEETVQAKKVCHYNSGDLSGDYRHCVDYLSIIFS